MTLLPGTTKETVVYDFIRDVKLDFSVDGSALPQAAGLNDEADGQTKDFASRAMPSKR